MGQVSTARSEAGSTSATADRSEALSIHTWVQAHCSKPEAHDLKLQTIEMPAMWKDFKLETKSSPTAALEPSLSQQVATVSINSINLIRHLQRHKEDTNMEWIRVAKKILTGESLVPCKPTKAGSRVGSGVSGQELCRSLIIRMFIIIIIFNFYRKIEGVHCK